jgi:hypothetical protein
MQATTIKARDKQMCRYCSVFSNEVTDITTDGQSASQSGCEAPSKA